MLLLRKKCSSQAHVQPWSPMGCSTKCLSGNSPPVFMISDMRSSQPLPWLPLCTVQLLTACIWAFCSAARASISSRSMRCSSVSSFGGLSVCKGFNKVQCCISSCEARSVGIPAYRQLRRSLPLLPHLAASCFFLHHRGGSSTTSSKSLSVGGSWN